MRVRILQGSITNTKCAVAVVNLFRGVKVPGGATGAMDKALRGAISAAIKEGKVKGEFGETPLLETKGKIPASEVLVLGLGPSSSFDLEEVRSVSAITSKVLFKKGVRNFATIIHGAGVGGLNMAEAARALVEGSFQGLKETGIDDQDKELIIVEFDPSKLGEIKRGVERAKKALKGRGIIQVEATL